LVYDMITRLARLRALFVIAPGTVFALRERNLGAEEAGRVLGVDYVVTGSVRAAGDRTLVSVDLVEARTARILWSEVFHHSDQATLRALDEIADRIVASVVAEIETLERNRALLKPPNSLDAWEAHHRGLWHMYQYRQEDNRKARQFFEAALRLDPTFSRAHAGLSFTYFQDAFQHWGPRESSIERAHETAARGLMADERDPAAHWAMGRALWLRQRHGESVAALGRSVELSPNFALEHYNLSFVNAIVGDAHSAVASSDHSRLLSPFDPMLFGMYGTRAMALARLGRFDEAARAAVTAAGRPNAFAHIHAIAACCLTMTGDAAQGRQFVATIRTQQPEYGIDDFFSAFPFEGRDRELFLRAAREVGLAR